MTDRPSRSSSQLSLRNATGSRLNRQSMLISGRQIGTWIATFVALAAGEVVGAILVIESSFGFGDIAMLVAAPWRGRGVGTALVAAGIEWSRAHGLHKLTLGVFPHNERALALYRKFRFVEEGRLVRHIRRANGELWDLIEMGLLL